MKKLSLEMLRLSSEEVLGRSQMKKITGGYGGSGCLVQCNNWVNYRPMPSASCGQGQILCSGGYMCFGC